MRALAGSRCEFELNPLGTRELKGLPAPIAICDVDWRVAARRHAASAARRFVDTAPGFPFAGRAEAFETLLIAWKETLEGARRAVLVSGEPGIGKTRLVTELVRHAHEAGTSMSVGSLRRRARRAVRAVRRSAASLRRERAGRTTARRARTARRRADAHACPSSRRAFPGSRRRCRPTPRPNATGCSRRSPTSSPRCRTTDPVILVLDDIHWADKPSLLLLRHLLRAGNADARCSCSRRTATPISIARIRWPTCSPISGANRA